jgi:hypothetical protein
MHWRIFLGVSTIYFEKDFHDEKKGELQQLTIHFEKPHHHSQGSAFRIDTNFVEWEGSPSLHTTAVSLPTLNSQLYDLHRSSALRFAPFVYNTRLDFASLTCKSWIDAKCQEVQLLQQRAAQQRSAAAEQRNGRRNNRWMHIFVHMFWKYIYYYCLLVLLLLKACRLLLQL